MAASLLATAAPYGHHALIAMCVGFGLLAVGFAVVPVFGHHLYGRA